ncbi:tetratricopeptide repeat protein [Pseudoxanthomonas sangjuensis]|uniref:tetratricopeptide repeat protein n=1 Tax=Pseudoxanthomonas sangjuensis TaxID=1503750 RepID=UPI001FE521D6|nr:sel1 repeat family protein [Pseudoxanthomonas sangjuensis]
MRRKMIAIALLVPLATAPAWAADAAKPRAFVPDVPPDAATDGFLEGHPDLFHRNAGFRRDKAGNPDAARKHYLLAARYGDKPSQARLGEMYWNGQGVTRDRVEGFLWMALAAERGYPIFTDMKLAYWNALAPDERELAKQRDRAMLAEYGDEAAKARQAKAMRRELSRSTGSLLGYSGANALRITAFVNGTATGIDPERLYAEDYWKLDLYWQTQDRVWRNLLDPRVDVGDVEVLRDGDADSGD